jgi:hypothetical protein
MSPILKIKLNIKLRDPNGKYIPLSELSYRKFKTDDRLKQRTIDSYQSVITQVNCKLNERTALINGNPRNFYWEAYAKNDVLDAIIHVLHDIYTIRSGSDLVMRMAPILTCLNMIPELPPSNLAKWISLKAQYREMENYKVLCQRLDIKTSTSTTTSTVQQIPDWQELRLKLEVISTSRAADPRLRVLATIYKYGYVLRIASIYQTSVSDSDSKWNHLDMDHGIWYINHSKVRVQSFEVPTELIEELRPILKDSVFSNGWLLPKKNGTPYTANTGIAHLTPWSSLDLPDCVKCRKSFETWHWYESGQSIEKVKEMSTILDHTKTTAIVNYTPPYKG